MQCMLLFARPAIRKAYSTDMHEQSEHDVITRKAKPPFNFLGECPNTSVLRRMLAEYNSHTNTALRVMRRHRQTGATHNGVQ